MPVGAVPGWHRAIRGLAGAPGGGQSLRLIPKIDKDPGIVAAAQTLAGRIRLLAAIMALVIAFMLLGVNDLAVAPLAAVSAYAGALRRHVILLATLLMLYAHDFWVDAGVIQQVIGQEGLAQRLDTVWLVRGSLVLFFGVSAGLIASWPRLEATGFLRRPTLCLILAFLTLVIAAQAPIAAGVPRVILWSMVMVFQPYLWFLAYALADRNAQTRQPVWRHLSVFHPFWGSTSTPFGKGLAYLGRYDAKTPEELAVTQLKGVKLACWTLILLVCLTGFSRVAHGLLRIPSFDQTFLDYLGGLRDPRYVGWASLAAFFIEDVLRMAVWGGAIVACARMAGFRLLRNTYRPLEARTLAEFWNRYYFYYKELLVDHFFYPVFTRCFRAHRRLRIFFATFMAACVGNLMYHFIRDIHFVAEMGWRKALTGEASHAFYTLLLALGVGLSQAWQRPRKVDGGWLRERMLPGLWIGFFFCVLHVFDAPLDRLHSIGQRAQFLSYLLGIDAWI